MDILLQSGRFAIVRLEPTAEEPDWIRTGSPFVSITRSGDELSVVCSDSQVPDSFRCSRGWAALKVAGPLDLSLVGILADLTGCLRDENISIFAISTFDTDYVLVPGSDLNRAIKVLTKRGHRVIQ